MCPTSLHKLAACSDDPAHAAHFRESSLIVQSGKEAWWTFPEDKVSCNISESSPFLVGWEHEATQDLGTEAFDLDQNHSAKLN